MVDGEIKPRAVTTRFDKLFRRYNGHCKSLRYEAPSSYRGCSTLHHALEIFAILKGELKHVLDLLVCTISPPNPYTS